MNAWRLETRAREGCEEARKSAVRHETHVESQGRPRMASFLRFSSELASMEVRASMEERASMEGRPCRSIEVRGTSRLSRMEPCGSMAAAAAYGKLLLPLPLPLPLLLVLVPVSALPAGPRGCFRAGVTPPHHPCVCGMCHVLHGCCRCASQRRMRACMRVKARAQQG